MRYVLCRWSGLRVIAFFAGGWCVWSTKVYSPACRALRHASLGTVEPRWFDRFRTHVILWDISIKNYRSSKFDLAMSHDRCLTVPLKGPSQWRWWPRRCCRLLDRERKLIWLDLCNSPTLCCPAHVCVCAEFEQFYAIIVPAQRRLRSRLVCWADQKRYTRVLLLA